MNMHVQIFWDRGAPSGLELPVSRKISQVMDLPVQVDISPLLFNGFVQSRNQFDAHQILGCMDTYKRRHRIDGLLLLVIGEDIFRPGGEYVFGLSRPVTGTAVLSSARLSNEYWNLPADDTLLIDRMVTEGSHEIGHLLSLDHCDDSRCIMSNPLCFDDLNMKKGWLCDECRARIKIPLPAGNIK